MSEDASAPAADEPQSWHSGFLTVDAANGSGEVPFSIWFNGGDKFALHFGLAGGSLESSVWTTSAGLEMVIHWCQRALDIKRGAQ